MNVALIALGIVCGLLGVALGVVGITLWHFINNRPFRYIYDEAKEREIQRLEAELSELRQKKRELEMRKQKPEPPKPDAAKECGVVPPKFDEQPRRKGKYKICISFWFNGGRPEWFHDLAEFYRTEGVRKCDFSPSCRMEEEKRLEFISRRIGVHYRAKGAFVRSVSITRRGKQYHFDHFPYPAGVQK